MNTHRFLLGLSVALLLGTSAEAKLFRNTYVSFELPERWDCHLEGTEWVCNSILKEPSREAIIVLTAKEVGPTDTLDQYEMLLKSGKATPADGGKAVTSDVKHVKKTTIGGQPWVDAMHLSSEIPNYYTRYLATVKDRLAILVTFSAHQRHFTKYSSDFFNAINSLKVVATNMNFQSNVAPKIPGSETLGNIPGGVGPDLSGGSFEDLPEEPKSGSSGETAAVLIGLGAVIAGYIYIKKKQAGK